jgi:diguanylate cyclase (GGDEF)-like protein
MTGWTLWTRPRAAVVFMVIGELLTVALSTWAIASHPIGNLDLIYFLVIASLGVAAAEVSRHVERLRRRLAETPHVNLTSVWTLSAAVLITPALAIATVFVLYGHMWLRVWRPITGLRAYRKVFSGCTVILSCIAARVVCDLAPTEGVRGFVSASGLVWMVLVIAAYSAVNSGLIAAALRLDAADGSFIELLGSWQDNSIEHATLCMGALTAVVMDWRPWLVVLIFLPLYVLHSSVLIRQLEYAATTDAKTGLLNATSWQSLATNELHRAERNRTEFGVLMVDLDHFKRVNDEYGHQVGDQVLRAVADAMRDEARDYDLCGRFGGEEFVILMPETGLTDSIDTAARICARIRALHVEDPITGESLTSPHLSASIGVATYPDAGSELDEILLAADNAMFAAKDSGRDQVRAVMPSRGPERRSPSPAE